MVGFFDPNIRVEESTASGVGFSESFITSTAVILNKSGTGGRGVPVVTLQQQNPLKL